MARTHARACSDVQKSERALLARSHSPIGSTWLPVRQTPRIYLAYVFSEIRVFVRMSQSATCGRSKSAHIGRLRDPSASRCFGAGLAAAGAGAGARGEFGRSPIGVARSGSGGSIGLLAVEADSTVTHSNGSQRAAMPSAMPVGPFGVGGCLRPGRGWPIDSINLCSSGGTARRSYFAQHTKYGNVPAQTWQRPGADVATSRRRRG
jgi:hypothetical protein